MTRPRKMERPQMGEKKKWSRLRGKSKAAERNTKRRNDLDIIKKKPELLKYYIKVQATLGPSPSENEMNTCIRMVKDFAKENGIKWSA